MGQKITLDTTFTDPALPKFYPHRLMNAGSLFLLNFNHPDGALSGIPANGATVNNIAWETAAAMVGGGATQEQMKATVTNTLTAQGGLVEITPKKGLHGIISQVNDLNVGNDFQIALPQKIREYIHANITHGIYVSMWFRPTRLHAQGIASDMVLLLQNTDNYAMGFSRNTTLPDQTGQPRLGHRTTPGFNQLASTFRNVAVNGLVGNPANTQPSYVKWGSGAAYASFELNKASSHILYQLYIEDLAVSGRTYAQADAADYALWQQAFGVGGPFYGDTFTDPATLP